MTYQHVFLIGLISFCFCSCQESPKSPMPEKDQAQQLIDRAISLHGGNRYEHSTIRLDFRDKSYTSARNGDAYTYVRSFMQEGVSYEDTMTPDDFSRKIGGEIQVVPDSMIRKYRNSINSVWYFALLPYKLNDAAVRKAYLGLTQIDGENYHKIQVSFVEEDGGEDHQDIFVYFFEEKTGLMKHLAYSYETDGGGLRFRKGYNFREIGGIRFADYVNFKGDPALPVQEIDQAYLQGELDTLSLIELKNIEVDSSVR